MFSRKSLRAFPGRLELRDEIRAFPEPVNGMVAAADTEKQESAVQIWGMLRVKKPAMSRLMLKSAKRASLIENLRSLRGLGKMRVR